MVLTCCCRASSLCYVCIQINLLQSGNQGLRFWEGDFVSRSRFGCTKRRGFRRHVQRCCFASQRYSQYTCNNHIYCTCMFYSFFMVTHANVSAFKEQQSEKKRSAAEAGGAGAKKQKGASNTFGKKHSTRNSLTST